MQRCASHRYGCLYSHDIYKVIDATSVRIPFSSLTNGAVEGGRRRRNLLELAAGW